MLRAMSAVCPIPLDGPLHPVFEPNLRTPAEQLGGAFGVEAAAWLTVGLAGIPANFASESAQAGYQSH
jgi:hypothetical protein